MPIKTVKKWYERFRCVRRCLGESRTLQSHKDESDVNSIVQRFQRTGELPPNPRGLEPRYEDVTGLQVELTEAYNKANSDVDRHYLALEEAKARKEQEAADQAKADEPATSDPDQQKARAARAERSDDGPENRE